MKPDATLDEWIDFYSPEKVHNATGYGGAAVPVHGFLTELRKRLQPMGEDDIQFMADEVIEVCGLPDGCGGTLYAALRDAWRMGNEGLSYKALKDKQVKENADWKAAHPDEDILF